jgi:hypothetical protein
MSPTQVAVTKVTPVTAALKTPAQNPPWWTRAYGYDVAAYNAQETPFLNNKSSHRRLFRSGRKAGDLALSGGTNDGGNTTTLDRQEPDIATAPNIPLTAAVVVAGNDGGNTTTLDRQEPDIATAPNIPLTAAVVVAGNDGGNTTLDRQGRHCYCSEYTFDRRRRRRWQ